MTRWSYAPVGEPLLLCMSLTLKILIAQGKLMPSSLSTDYLSDLDLADLTFGSKNWDRRRSNQAKVWSTECLERAANHLIEDQMSESRVFWPGAMEAVRILRDAIVEIRSETTLDERAARVAASWLPKYTLARHARRNETDA